MAPNWLASFYNWLVYIHFEIASVAMDYRFTWQMGISTILTRPLTVPLHSPCGRQMPAVRAVQGDCERVYKYLDQHAGKGTQDTVGLLDTQSMEVMLVSTYAYKSCHITSCISYHFIYNSPLFLSFLSFLSLILSHDNMMSYCPG